MWTTSLAYACPPISRRRWWSSRTSCGCPCVSFPSRAHSAIRVHCHSRAGQPPRARGRDGQLASKTFCACASLFANPAARRRSFRRSGIFSLFSLFFFLFSLLLVFLQRSSASAVNLQTEPRDRDRQVPPGWRLVGTMTSSAPMSSWRRVALPPCLAGPHKGANSIVPMRISYNIANLQQRTTAHSSLAARGLVAARCQAGCRSAGSQPGRGNKERRRRIRHRVRWRRVLEP